MKSARIVFFVLIVCAMVVSVLACISGGDGGGGSGTPQSGYLMEDDLIATYGAGMFHQQLTAMARDQATPAAP